MSLEGFWPTWLVSEWLFIQQTWCIPAGAHVAISSALGPELPVGKAMSNIKATVTSLPTDIFIVTTLGEVLR